jgi:SPP1 family predicted phage head-tail adaptor
MIERLRHRVTIQERVVTKNNRGADTISWSDVATVYAEIRSVAGREENTNDQITPTAAHQVTIRYRRNITTQHRIKWQSRLFGISEVAERDNRMRMLLLTCNELVNEDRVL